MNYIDRRLKDTIPKTTITQRFGILRVEVESDYVGVQPRAYEFTDYEGLAKSIKKELGID